MQTARPHRMTKHHGLDERTKEDRRKDRLAALEKARSARRAKADVSVFKCALVGMAVAALLLLLLLLLQPSPGFLTD
eukprot:COSAG02_NODE_596_length_19794_cov_14.707591_10_plen_77_part_00